MTLFNDATFSCNDCHYEGKEELHPKMHIKLLHGSYNDMDFEGLLIRALLGKHGFVIDESNK